MESVQSPSRARRLLAIALVSALAPAPALATSPNPALATSTAPVLAAPPQPGPATLVRVSTSSAGGQADRDSGINRVAISADGRYVAFDSYASNLVTGDTNQASDVFVSDVLTGAVERVSVATGGGQITDGFAIDPDISADGRYVVFSAYTSVLTPEPTRNNIGNVFVHDRVARTTTLLTVRQTGASHGHASISGDGRRVVYTSSGSSSASRQGSVIHLSERADAGTRRMSVPIAVTGASPEISDDGRHVVFSTTAPLVASDRNGVSDVYLRDIDRGSTERVSTPPGGGDSDDTSNYPAVSADGRYVAFVTYADNLVPGDDDQGVVLVDRARGVIELMTVSVTGRPLEFSGYWPSVSGDGRYVAFMSADQNLVPGDRNFVGDIFLRDRRRRVTEVLSVAPDGSLGNAYSWRTAVSRNGRHVVFASDASNLVPGDINGRRDVFLRYRGPGRRPPVPAHPSQPPPGPYCPPQPPPSGFHPGPPRLC
ncbi:hypothetical protein AB0K04_28050 [Micromonospora coxensis]|uniref:TolB family protein n=1 Tax=Micromonospora coxensis TaxID=356852 RepID=UPI003425814D